MRSVERRSSFMNLYKFDLHLINRLSVEYSYVLVDDRQIECLCSRL